MQYETITVEVRDQITQITLNRAAVLNAINQRMHDELQYAFDSFAGAGSQRIAVIRGAGESAFCAGSDLKSMAERGRAHDYQRSGYAGLIERFELDKPLIAAVDGVAVGGGFELALACDIVVATRRSRFGLPEPLVGAVALGGGLHRLARQAGLKRAMGLILTGDIIAADAAYDMGLITALVDHDDLDASVESWCQRILRCAPLATQASKQAVMHGLDEPSLARAMRQQARYAAFAKWYTSDDRHEGACAFAEKRAPRWQGR